MKKPSPPPFLIDGSHAVMTAAQKAALPTRMPNGPFEVGQYWLSHEEDREVLRVIQAHKSGKPWLFLMNTLDILLVEEPPAARP